MQKVSGVEPLALQNQPVPIPELELYRAAYRRLSKARQWNDGNPQAIALSEMFAYCQGLGLHGAEFQERFLDTMQAMDAAYLTGIAKKQEAAQATQGKSDVVPTKLGGDNG